MTPDTRTLTDTLSATFSPTQSATPLARLTIATTLSPDVPGLLQPLVAISAANAAGHAATLKRGRPLDVWELLDSHSHHVGFVTRPDRSDFRGIRQGQQLAAHALSWVTAPAQLDREVGFGDDGLLVLTLPIINNDYEDPQVDEINAAGVVPASLKKAPSPLQLRPYGQPDAPCRLAWRVAGATLTKYGVEWHPELNDPSDWKGVY